jgi:hypothetical protein
MASKQLRISSFGDNHVSSPHLAQIDVDQQIKHKTFDLEIFCPLRAQTGHKCY